jgi:hypothetical protein
MILLAVETGRPHPVFEREIVGVMDTHLALLRRIDEKYAAK